MGAAAVWWVIGVVAAWWVLQRCDGSHGRFLSSLVLARCAAGFYQKKRKNIKNSAPNPLNLQNKTTPAEEQGTCKRGCWRHGCGLWQGGRGAQWSAAPGLEQAAAGRGTPPLVQLCQRAPQQDKCGWGRAGAVGKKWGGRPTQRRAPLPRSTKCLSKAINSSGYDLG